jgi:hypothetical protein
LQNPFAVYIIEDPGSEGQDIEISLDEMHPGVLPAHFPSLVYSVAQFHADHLRIFLAEAVGEPPDSASHVQHQFPLYIVLIHAHPAAEILHLGPGRMAVNFLLRIYHPPLPIEGGFHPLMPEKRSMGSSAF